MLNFKIMKTLRILSAVLIILILTITSCKKDSDPVEKDKTMADLVVPASFDWTSSCNYELSVNIIGDANGQTLELYEMDGDKIDSKTIFNNQVIYNFQLPDDIDSVRIYSPVTFISKYFPVDIEIVDFEIGQGFKTFGSRDTDYALKLNGESNYIEVDNSVAGGIVIKYPFTFSAWLKTPGPGKENGDMVLVNIADQNVASVYYGIYLRKFKEKYKAEVKSRDGEKEYRKSTNQNLADDTWHQVVGVFTADGKRKLYLDGIYKGMSKSVLDFNTKAVIVTFGRWGDKTPKSYYNGLLDNICIWNKELSATEISNYYNNLPSGNEANLEGFWKFNEGSGTTASNSASSGGYSGNIFGAAYENISGSPDSDGDGVPDDTDVWPNDPTKAYLTIYPSGSKYYFHMYEDLWPGLGDYDFNDVVLKTKLHTYKNGQNQLVGGKVVSSVYWIGGGIPRGAGMEWFKSNGSATQLTYLPDQTVTFTEPTNVVTDPVVFNAVQLFDGNIIESLNDTVDFEYTWDHTVAGNSLWVQVYIYMNRDHEVHMYGHPPTKAADMSLFGTANDASQTTWAWNPGDQFTNPANFYKTINNLPWGLELIATEFRVPNEKIEIINAYPQFQAWAESGGSLNVDWYKYPDVSKTFLPGE